MPRSGSNRPESQRLPVNPRRHKVAPENRKRVVTACNACNVRRVKCSGDRPCRQCDLTGRDCIYPAPVVKVTINKAELDELRRKAAEYERSRQVTVPGPETIPDDAIPNNTIPENTMRKGTIIREGAVVCEGTIIREGAIIPEPNIITDNATGLEVHQHPLPAVSEALKSETRQSSPFPFAFTPVVPVQDPQASQTMNRGQQIRPLGQENHQVRTVDQAEDVHESTEGRLLNDPDGHTRFLGATSGATFLDNLKEFMNAVLPIAFRDYDTINNGNEFLSSQGSYQTYDSRPLCEQNVDLYWLPQENEKELMLSEFRHFIQDGNGSWPSGGIYWWGTLDPTSFKRPSPHSDMVSQHRHLAFFNAAAAIVTQGRTTELPPGGIEAYLSEAFFARARMLLGNPLDITRFHPHDVAALALMGFYLIEMNRRDSAYMCVSNAMHISIMHGFHRNYRNEETKRTFWTLYVLDRWLSCLMGRPPTIMDDAIRLPPPCDAPFMPPADGLKAHVDLSRISGHIVCNTYCVSPWEPATGPLVHLEKAVQMLEQWQSSLPPRLQLASMTLSDDPACCLLHMAYNQLIIIAIRPIFFAAVKKTVARRLVQHQSYSLDNHPQLSHIKRCIASAELNIRLARHILARNHPRKLLQAGLHFIFNAATCLILQELVNIHGATPRDGTALASDLDFVIARFDEESRIGSNYGKDCANVLRDLRVLIHRIRVHSTFGHIMNGTTMAVPTPIQVELHALLQVRPSWAQGTYEDPLVPRMQGEHELAAIEEMGTWLNDDWQMQSPYLV